MKEGPPSGCSKPLCCISFALIKMGLWVLRSVMEMSLAPLDTQVVLSVSV